MSHVDVNGVIAFTSGVLSFFSPCVLPLVPSYLVFISGISLDNYNELLAGKYRKIVLMHSIAFVLGFSLVFVALGVTSSFIGAILAAYQTYLLRLGGLMLIVLGLYYLNIVKIPFLSREKVIHLKEKPIGLAGSFFVGITFSLGWTPCIGPALSSILILASTAENPWSGVYLLGLYSLGLAIPFVVSALIFEKLFGLMRKTGRIVQYSMKVLGILLVIIGLLLFTGYYNTLNLWLGEILSAI
jgi:cytochrome c-type biogenesis protein